jgi:N utilization substance protein A
LVSLFTIEAPELQSGAVEVKAIAREAGARTKIAVHAVDEHLDPVGSLVGQRGVRVSTVMSELGGEKIDIIEWSPVMSEFIEDALSPAQVMEIRIESEPNEEKGERGHAIAEVAGDQQSLAIGRGGQNVRLAAKLTGWKIDIVSAKTGEELAEADADGVVELEAPADSTVGKDDAVLESEEATTTKPDVETVLEDVEETRDRDVTEDMDEADEVDTPEEAEDEMAKGEQESDKELAESKETESETEDKTEETETEEAVEEDKKK